MSEYPKISSKKCKHCSDFIFMKRKRDEIKEFCNRKCATQFSSVKFERTCSQCSEVFITQPSHDYTFCSKNCANKSRSKLYIRVCNNCSKEFTLKNIAYEKRGGGKYCSRECSSRIYSFNEDYFELINSEHKSYWLGFLFADGNIYKNQMTVRLSSKDHNHLEIFKEHLKSKHPIHTSENESIFYIGSIKLASDLEEKGMMPNKTFKVCFPEINDNLIRHFIRGVFDGDGCIYVGKRNKTFSIYSASQLFRDQMFKHLNSQGLNPKRYTQKSKGKVQGYTVVISRKSDINILFNYLYDKSTVYLERKYNKFLC